MFSYSTTHKCSVSVQRLLASCLCCFLQVKDKGDPDRPTHPKQLAQVSGAAVQRVWVGQQCGFGPAAGGTVQVLVLSGINSTANIHHQHNLPSFAF